MTEPLIIKKKRVSGGDGHHGGAWKVAYADFVTAMMAFFLLMWLLNATTEEQRKGIADYFDPAIPISPISGGGTDMLSGDTVYATDSLAHNAHGGDGSADPSEFELITEIEQSLVETMSEEQFSVTLSDEGIVVELMEADDAPLFSIGQALPSDILQNALSKMAPVLIEKRHPVKIVGHTDSLPFRKDAQYTNWELSADRANVARRLLTANGFPNSHLDEVVGKADKMPIVPDAQAPQNRRISVTILTSKKLPEPAALDTR